MRTLFLCGDVMTGRGVDQILPHPGSPELHEGYASSACEYVELAERAHGPLPRRVPFDYIWGDALRELDRFRPDARIANLETAVTTSEEPWPGKGIHYRMHPDNVACLAAAGLDCCVLANNHVMDWGRAGLLETLATLRAAGIRTAGAGEDETAAAAPALISRPGAQRILVFAYATPTSGVPEDWSATRIRPGVNFLADLSPRSLEAVASGIARWRSESDIVVVSIHWGPNWGYEVPAEERAFAHALVEDARANVVHGHSSHHPKAIEVHRGRLILYGCGDFLNDYEGIEGDHRFRSDLALMYLPTLDSASGRLTRLELVPTRIRRFRVERAGEDDARLLRGTLERECARFATTFDDGPQGRWTLRWETRIAEATPALHAEGTDP